MTTRLVRQLGRLQGQASCVPAPSGPRLGAMAWAARQLAGAAPRLIVHGASGQAGLPASLPSRQTQPLHPASFLQLSPARPQFDGHSNWNTDIPIFGVWASFSKLHVFFSLIWCFVMFFLLTVPDELLWFQYEKAPEPPDESEGEKGSVDDAEGKNKGGGDKGADDEDSSSDDEDKSTDGDDDESGGGRGKGKGKGDGKCCNGKDADKGGLLSGMKGVKAKYGAGMNKAKSVGTAKDKAKEFYGSFTPKKGGSGVQKLMKKGARI